MDFDDLTEEQQVAVTRFQEFTGIDSLETTIQYLIAHQWNVERAINTALVSGSEPPTPDDVSPEPQPTEPPTSSSSSLIVRYVPNAVVQLLRTPLSILYTFYVKLQPFLPWSLARVAFSFFRSLLWRPTWRTPLEEIDLYCAYFNRKYGAIHPTFYRGRLTQVLQDARRETRLVFIYLHDKNSSLCDRFSREILCGDALRSIIGNHFFWSASRETQEGILASTLLQATSYPCFGIIAHHGSQQTVPLRFERYSDSGQCLAEIISAVQNADQILEYNRERRNVSNSRDQLLQEQNAAYLESVRADQEKAEQRAREENERRLLEEEEQRKLQAFATFRDQLKQTLPAEPAATEAESVQVSIRLPADEPLRRRFHREDPAKSLFEFAWTQPSVPDQFELFWGYPRKRYQYEHMGDQTIGDVIDGRTETCYLEQIGEEK